MGDISCLPLKNYREKYKLQVFVESGTLEGDGIQAALDAGFKEIISLDIDEEMVAKAHKRFANNNRVHIYYNDSVVWFQSSPPIIRSNRCLYWLDAHFPGATNNNELYLNPENTTVRELKQLIKIPRITESVIILDDLWLYEDGEYAWGSYINHLRKIGLDTRNIVKENIIPDKLPLELFAYTHDISRDYRHQGYLIMEPKYG